MTAGRYNWVEASLGVAVVAVAGLFFTYAYTSGNASRLIQGDIISANFERVDGLNIGNDVKISGVKVGAVRSLDIDKVTYQAKVTMQLNDSIQVPVDSSAEIVSESLLGGKYIAIIPGGEETMISSNGQITDTRSAVNFETLISKFMFSKSEEDKIKKAPETNSEDTEDLNDTIVENLSVKS
jgi:phospholipid/cholesterol/gamma-HCH transport system substrate-binding protein